MADTVRPLAGNLRRLRRRAGLSVVELARRADLGRATLTQLEAGDGNPTLETLYALANELGVALADLIADPDPSRGTRLLRRGEGSRTRGAAVEAWLLDRRRFDTLSVELYAVDLHSGEPQRSAPHPAGTREHLHVHSGRVLVGPVDAPLELTAGDYATYPADGEHQYRALPHGSGDDAPARATLLILTPDAAPVGEARA